MEIVKGKIGNALTSTAADHIVAVAHDLYDESQKMYLDDINEYLITKSEKLSDMLSCFSTGVWENDLGWGKGALWNNNKYEAIENLQSQIDALGERATEDEKHLNESDARFNAHVAANVEKFQEVDARLDRGEERISELEAIANEHDAQIKELLDGLSCFGDGQWNNQLKWSNADKWENSNMMCDTFEDVYAKIEEHRQAIEQINGQIDNIRKTSEDTLAEINSTFDELKNEHESFKEEHNAFRQEHEEFRSEHQSMYDSISKVAKDIESINAFDDEQQRQIDVLLYRLSVISNGAWDNNLLWVNNSEWSNKKTDGSACDCPDDTAEALEWLKEQVNAINEHTPVIEEAIGKNAQDITDANARIDELNNGLAAATESIDQNASSIADNLSAIKDNAAKIQENEALIQGNSESINDLAGKHVTDIREVKSSIRAIQRKDVEQDDNIYKIGEHFSCYADGVWGDLFLWSNDHLWNNDTDSVLNCKGSLENYLDELNSKVDSNNTECNSKIEENSQSIEALDILAQNIIRHDDEQDNKIEQIANDINANKEAIDSNTSLISINTESISSANEKIVTLEEKEDVIEENVTVIQSDIKTINKQLKTFTKEQSAQNDKITQIAEHFSCYADGVWGDWFLWSNDDVWANDENVLKETISDIQVSVSNNEGKIAELEATIASLMDLVASQQKRIDEHQKSLDSIMIYFTIPSMGVWNNGLLWDNDAEWSNASLQEKVEESSSVTVKAYDEENETVVLDSIDHSYDEPTETLIFE